MPVTIDELRKKYTEIKGHVTGLAATAKAENRDLTEEETKSVDAWLADGKQVTESIVAAEQAQEKATADRNARDDRMGQFFAFGERPAPTLTRPVQPNLPADPAADAHERRSNPNITGGPDSREFASFGEQLYAVHRATDSPGDRDPRLVWAKFGTPMAADGVSGMSEGKPSDGGFLVQQDYMGELFEKAYLDSPILEKIETIPIGPQFNGVKLPAIDETSRATGSRRGAVVAYWRAEGFTVAAGKLKTRLIDLNLKDLMAFCYMTQELLDDTVALEAWVSKGVSAEMRFKLEDSIINGTGAGQPQGIVNSGVVVTAAKETEQAAATITYENIVQMWSRMWAPSRSTAVWLVNQEVETQLYTMKLNVGTGGQAVFLPPGGASQSPYASLFGRPVIPVEYCAALGTEGDIQLVDLSQYIAIDKGRLKTASSMHVRFLHNEETFRFTYRFDGQPMWNAPLTPYKGTSGKTLSPFVSLETR